MAKVSFRLVMPERELLATEADMVVVPGSEGDFGVLPGHAPLISTVRPGVLEVFQGNKAEQRLKMRYTEYPGGLKTETYGSVRQRRPEKLIEDAVRRMLPKNRLSRHMMKKLKVYPGAEHPHAGVKVIPL